MIKHIECNGHEFTLLETNVKGIVYNLRTGRPYYGRIERTLWVGNDMSLWVEVGNKFLIIQHGARCLHYRIFENHPYVKDAYVDSSCFGREIA